MRSTSRYQRLFKGGYKSDEVDDLIATGKIERDEKRRLAIYERLQELAGRDMPVFPLYHEVGLSACRASISGLRQRVFY